MPAFTIAVNVQKIADVRVEISPIECQNACQEITEHTNKQTNKQGAELAINN